MDSIFDDLSVEEQLYKVEPQFYAEQFLVFEQWSVANTQLQDIAVFCPVSFLSNF